MKRWTIVLSSVLLAAALAGCKGSEDAGGGAAPGAAVATASVAPSAGSANETGAGAILALERDSFTLKQWKNDGSHMTAMSGTLKLGDLPVAGAVIHAGASKRDIVTQDDGSFALTVDRSLLSETPVKVVAVDQAHAGGKPLGDQAASALLKAEAFYSVYYPIEITRADDAPGKEGEVEVHARIVSDPGDVVTFFQVDKYRIGGTVKDADGAPVKDAVVWIDRDEGEGFGKSTPTDAEGRYELYYLPEQEEGTNLSVTIGTTRYTLPENRVFHIPEETSVQINITLPSEGTVIDDKPPTLVSVTSPGAMYTGVLAGLRVPKGTSYTVTIPDQEGRFVLTLRKSVWDMKPRFFETKLTRFVEDRQLSWGDSLPSGFLQAEAGDPSVEAGGAEMD
ncbi:Carboxypeptidase regulatory-like domain-containing protein [Cohnella sp. OV330]|uniref:carboxypeptidase-like regulatory domain-containing protein n=1 Tax=Cohnella sp. OV330 TaxID=1855288 RepID=UPI0008E3E031|nr:carboxypeptidase-like regulatory domain-containing protein [Cohnella sp. OV330]SFB26961.1 Carboxypeptidase regulatory-like domain-containing protein [Cohnella sp. OV330]